MFYLVFESSAEIVVSKVSPFEVSFIVLSSLVNTNVLIVRLRAGKKEDKELQVDEAEL